MPGEFRSALIAAALLACLSGAGIAAAAPLILNGYPGKTPLAGHLELLRDPDGGLTIEEIVRDGRAFAPLPGNVAAGYLGRGALWLRFSLRRPAREPSLWWLELDPPFHRDVRLYEPLPDGRWGAHRGGEGVPFSSREIPFRNATFRLELPPGSAQTFYLRIASDRSLLLRPVLWIPERLQVEAVKQSLLHGFYLGCIVLILVANAVYWWRLGDSLFVCLGAHVGALGLFLAARYGYVGQFLSPEAPEFAGRLLPLSVALIAGTGAGVFSALTNLGSRFPRLNRAYRRFFFAVSFVGAIAAAVGGHTPLAPLVLVGLLLNAVVNAALAVVLVLRGGAGVLFPFLAVLAFLPAVVLRVPGALGWLPTAAFADELTQLSVVLHVILMHTAVTDRVGRLKREKDAAEMALESERKRTEEHRQFLGLVSHEVRTPLSVIDGAAQLLLFRPQGEQGRVDQAARIRSAVRRVADLLDSCLTDERLDAPDCALQPRPEDIGALARDVAGRVQQGLEKHHVRLDLGPLPEAFPCDGILVRTALSNLLENAVKYSPGGGAISLRAWRGRGGDVFLEVEDPGVGVPPEKLVWIFERFYRGHQVAGVPGAGLGLHIVRRIAELHGGDVTCTSRPGEGSIFTLRLRRAPSTGEGGGRGPE